MFTTRTSPSQFELMVDFMERHGDLYKPGGDSKLGEGAECRIGAMIKWVELTSELNLDRSGTAKPIEKWKKVWSDFKNNTKRKALKIHRASEGSMHSSKLVLTDLEKRVLLLTKHHELLGPKAATGVLSIEEVSIESSASSAGHSPHFQPFTQAKPIKVPAKCDTRLDDSDKPDTSFSTMFPTIETVDFDGVHPTTHHAHVGMRNTTRRPRGIHRRPRRPVVHRIDDALQEFLDSNKRWHTIAEEFTTEHLRLRSVELRQQAQWQTLFAKFIDVLERFC